MFGWEQTTWDRNDLVESSAWYTAREGYSGPDANLEAEADAASKAALHDGTPTRVLMDSQGRPYCVEQHAGFDESDPPEAILYTTTSTLDVEGNVLAVEDARGNVAESRTWGMAGQALVTESEDAGDRVLLSDAMGGVRLMWDGLDRTHRWERDALRRPVDHWVKEGEGDWVLLERVLYGERLVDESPSVDPALTNHRGRVFRTYDGAGVVTVPSYDFKGHAVSVERKLLLDRTEDVDWVVLEAETTLEDMATEAAALLEGVSYTTSFAYDALNRVTSQTTPDDSVTRYAFDEGGLLKSVEVQHHGAGTWLPVVVSLEYDAKGQRTRELLGDDGSSAAGMERTYTYDPKTFRVTRIQTERTSDDAVLQDLRYTYDPVGNVTRVRDYAQSTVYFDNTAVSPDQDFSYDPLYRLIEASGRESIGLGATPPRGEQMAMGAQPDASDPAAVRQYTEVYEYDAVSNLLKLVHDGGVGGSWTREYNYSTLGNRLQSTWASGDSHAGTTYTAPGVYTYSDEYTYDAHGQMTSMPRLGAMTWSLRDELFQVEVGSETLSFQYGGGTRVRKYVEKTGSTTEERIYLGAFELYVKRVSGVVSEVRETLHVNDGTRRVAMLETKTTDDGDPVTSPVGLWRFQLDNHLGTAGAETTEEGEVISYEETTPYGSAAYRAMDSAVDVSARRYRYTGMEQDEETGLQLHGARYYAPWLGRWTAADPIGLGGGVNRYAYCDGDPVGSRDESGTRATPPEDAANDEARRVAGDSLRGPVVDALRKGRELGIGAAVHGTADEAALAAADMLTAFAEADQEMYAQEVAESRTNRTERIRDRGRARKTLMAARRSGDRDGVASAKKGLMEARSAVRDARKSVRELTKQSGERGRSVEWSSLIIQREGKFGFTTPLPGSAFESSNASGIVGVSEGVRSPTSRELTAAGVDGVKVGHIHSHPVGSDSVQGGSRANHDGLNPSGETGDRGVAVQDRTTPYLLNPRGRVTEYDEVTKNSLIPGGEGVEADRAKTAYVSGSTGAVAAAEERLSSAGFSDAVSLARNLLDQIDRRLLLMEQRR